MGRAQGCRGGRGGREVWVDVQVSPDLRPGVGLLAWTSNVRRILPIESVEAEVIAVIAIVFKRGKVVDVVLRESVGEHCCGVVIGAQVERDADFEDAKVGGRRW